MKILLPALALPALFVAAGLVAPATAQAAPRQYVVVVAEGLSPQILEMGKGYLRKADDDAELTTSFDALMEEGKAAPVGAGVIGELRGLLENAEASGFKTGLVTTGDVSVVAPIFYNITADGIGAATAKYEFLAGAGRAKLATAGAAVKAAGGTYISNSEELSEETKGRVLALQADTELSYAIDRAPEDEAGFSELATLAMDTLGAGESPYVLVVHDTLVNKALSTRDTPALAEQFREINSILGDAIARRDDNADLGVAAIMTGGSITPRYTGNDLTGAFFTLSTLGRSFAGVTDALKGADSETITAFADSEEGEYRGWKISDAQKARITAGTLTGEAAARAAYEPVLKFEFAQETAAPVAYTVGFDASGGLVAALKAAIARPAR